MNVVARFRPDLRQRSVGRTGTRGPGPTATGAGEAPLTDPRANDGASGVAFCSSWPDFSKNGPMVGVDIVLFDGEDLGTQADQRIFRGSNRYVRISGQNRRSS